MFAKLFTNDRICGIIYTKAENAFKKSNFPILSYIVGGLLKTKPQGFKGDDFLTYKFISRWYCGRDKQ